MKMDIPDDFSDLRNILENNSLNQSVAKCDVHGECNSVSLGYNVCYIVAAVVCNENDEVLLIQEAKQSCYKKWYLPAGRVDPNESLAEAVKREVREEAGLDFEPKALVCIEEKGGFWIRFTFTGLIVGGNLKTTDQADKESLQATWYTDIDSVALRCHDILPLILRAKSYNITLKSNSSVPTLPVIFSQTLLCIRVVFCFKTGGKTHTILSRGTGLNGASFLIPLACFLQADCSINDPVQRLLDKVFTDSAKLHVDAIFILGLEHSGQSSKNGDGIVFNLAVNLNYQGAEQNGQLPELQEKFVFCVVSSDVCKSLEIENLKMRSVPHYSFGLK